MNMSASRRTTILYLISGIAVFGFTFLGTYMGKIPTPEISVTWTLPDASQARYVPQAKQIQGPELAFIYIGSSTCRAANNEDLPDKIEALKLLIQQKASLSGRSFAAIGISVDLAVEQGIEHLEKFGRFDEVMTGRGWVNEGLMKYVWEDLPGRGATPQVVVVDRTVEHNGPGENAIHDEVVVTRKIGPEELQQWLANNAPIPTLSIRADAGTPSNSDRP